MIDCDTFSFFFSTFVNIYSVFAKKLAHMRFDVFISYSRKDGKLVQVFHDELVKAGYKVWMDLDGIESSDVFKVKIVSAIKASQVFLFFSSYNSNSSEWTIKEVDLAVHLKKIIIPIKLDNTDYHDSLLFDLLGIDYISYTKTDNLQFAMNRLLRTLIIKLSNEPPTKHDVPKIDQASRVDDKTIGKNHFSITDYISKYKFWFISLLIIIAFGILGISQVYDTENPDNYLTSEIQEGVDEPEIKRGVDEADMKKAMFFYEEGLEAYLKEDYSTAVKMLRPSAELGYDKAQTLFGFCYAKGHGVEFSFKEAVKWYMAAAEQGNPEAQNKLAWCYQHGEGVEQSYTMAFDLNMKAAMQGLTLSQNNVAAFYFYGWGVHQSYEEAHAWYSLAAEKGEPMSLYHLGLIYEGGLGVEVSKPLAITYYRLAAAKGIQDANVRLNALLSDN